MRQDEFKAIFSIMNDGCVESSKFVSPSSTRWLVKGKCIFVILSQWHELKAYFSVIADKDRNYHARILNEMLADDINFLYLTFVLPIIKEFENVNAAFQATNADPSKVFKELDLLHQSILQRIDCCRNANSISTASMGAKFDLELSKSKINENSKLSLKRRCFDFLTEITEQLEKRLSSNIDNTLCLRAFKPNECLSQCRRPFQKFPLEFLEFTQCDAMILEEQYNKLLMIDWKDEFSIKEISTDPIEFWSTVSKYENSVGTKCFEELA